MTTILHQIIAHKTQEIVGLSMRLKNARPQKSKRSFLQALISSKHKLALIAEIKKKSPSRGDILPDADVLSIAEIYEKSGASAISVLTDYQYFGGSLADLQQVSRMVDIPVLRKDFILDASQILEARMAEADSVLLMVSVLKETKKIQELIQYAQSLGMEPLVETHDEAEIKIAVQSGAKIIGVNARYFSDLSVDITRLPTLLKKIPQGIVRVAESGMKTREDMQYLSPHCDAVLIGTTLMEEGEEGIEEKIKEIMEGKKSQAPSTK
ncbi:indole-3-glycerol phosphate synthase TrpC [Candidatus Gracilibacteria bacterium]|nr:indole-3-glycerol phosphate synthase TrpC [Candidatus Gracilibacteria bacterium]